MNLNGQKLGSKNKCVFLLQRTTFARSYTTFRWSYALIGTARIAQSLLVAGANARCNGCSEFAEILQKWRNTISKNRRVQPITTHYLSGKKRFSFLFRKPIDRFQVNEMGQKYCSEIVVITSTSPSHIPWTLNEISLTNALPYRWEYVLLLLLSSMSCRICFHRMNANNVVRNCIKMLVWCCEVYECFWVQN